MVGDGARPRVGRDGVRPNPSHPNEKGIRSPPVLDHIPLYSPLYGVARVEPLPSLSLSLSLSPPSLASLHRAPHSAVLAYLGNVVGDGARPRVGRDVVRPDKEERISLYLTFKQFKNFSWYKPEGT